MVKNKLQIGDKVKLTGKFLKNTGQRTGRAGLDTWIVMGFWGDDNRMVLVNEPHICQTDPMGDRFLTVSRWATGRLLSVKFCYVQKATP